MLGGACTKSLDCNCMGRGGEENYAYASTDKAWPFKKRVEFVSNMLYTGICPILAHTCDTDLTKCCGRKDREMERKKGGRKYFIRSEEKR